MTNKVDSIRAELNLTKTDCDLRVLRSFFASFCDDSEEYGGPEIGGITGWVAWGAYGEPIAAEGDAHAQDSSLISIVGERLVHDQGWEEELIDNLLLIDRVWIKEEYRGQGLLGQMIEELVETLRFDKIGCFAVAQLEPQKPDGGPYEPGSTRDRALAGLIRSFETAEFVPFPSTDAYYRRWRNRHG